MCTSEDPLTKYSCRVKIGEYSINYFKVGEGPQPIFAFPGIMAPIKSSFIPLIVLMENEPGFRAKYTFYGWDQPGYFGSRPPLRKIQDVDFHKDVELGHAFLEDLGQDEQFVIMGYSAGAQMALFFAMKYPHLVKKLLLWGAWDLFEEEDVKLNRWYRDLNNVAGPFSALLLDHFEGEQELMMEHWTTWHDMILREYSGTDRETWDLKFQKVLCPTLIIWGKRDMIVPIRQAKDLQRKIKRSRLEIMEKAPHNAHHTFPNEFFKLMVAFLAELDENKTCT